MHINLYEVKLNEKMNVNANELQNAHTIQQQFDANSTSLNEEKRVSFIESPFSSTHGPDPPVMENEIFNLMK